VRCVEEGLPLPCFQLLLSTPNCHKGLRCGPGKLAAARASPPACLASAGLCSYEAMQLLRAMKMPEPAGTRLPLHERAGPRAGLLGGRRRLAPGPRLFRIVMMDVMSPSGHQRLTCHSPDSLRHEGNSIRWRSKTRPRHKVSPLRKTVRSKLPTEARQPSLTMNPRARLAAACATVKQHNSYRQVLSHNGSKGAAEKILDIEKLMKLTAGERATGWSLLKRYGPHALDGANGVGRAGA